MKTLLPGLLLFFAHLACAQQCTTLIYIGVPLTIIYEGQGPYPLTYPPPLIGTVTLSAPLPPNATALAVSPVSWDFQSEMQGFTSSSPNTAPPYVGAAATFSFSTDAQGNIIGWNVEASYSNYSLANSTQLGFGVEISTNSQYQQDYVGKAADGEGTGGGSNLDVGSSGVGAWYCAAPVVDPLAAQVATLQAQLSALQAQENNDAWQAAGWKARAATLAQQLANANNTLAVLKAKN